MTTKNRVIERLARSKGSLKHHRKAAGYRYRTNSDAASGQKEDGDKEVAGSSKDELITEKTELKFDGNGYKREWRSLYGGG